MPPFANLIAREPAPPLPDSRRIRCPPRHIRQPYGAVVRDPQRRASLAILADLMQRLQAGEERGDLRLIAAGEGEHVGADHVIPPDAGG